MTGPHVPLKNLDVLTPTDLLNLPPHLLADFAPKHRLAILRAEDAMTVHRVKRMGRPTVVPHGRPSYRKPPEGVA